MTVLDRRPRGRLPIRVEQAPGWLRWVLPAVLVVAAVHVAMVAGHYVVGSFDDDSHYLLLAKAFAHGRGYVDTSMRGAPVETLYPPGYPLLITPLVWLFGPALWPLRVLSALAFLGCFPLLDRLLRRHAVPPVARAGTLLLFALSPTAATFASEVMPETVFLLVLLGVLLALPTWEEQSRLLTPAGAVVALGAPYLLLLKAAGLPMLAGVVLWLLLRRRWRHLAVTVTTSVVMLLPLLLVRMTSGPVVGTRYTNEYGLAGPLGHAIWNGVRTYVTDAIPTTLVPTTGAGLHGHFAVVDVLLAIVRYSAAPLVVLGWLGWLRRRVDVTVLIVPLYLAETVPFPFVNERRVVLLLPLVVAWYVLGWAGLAAWWRARWPYRRRQAWLRHAAAVPAVLVLPILVWQLPRDYLLHRGESTPAARGSGYVAALREMTPPGWSIATNYQWTIADLTGRTADNTAHLSIICLPGHPADPEQVHQLFLRAHAATALSGWLKWPHNMDNSCILDVLTAASWAVPVYHGTDTTTVFVLLGPGTPRDGLRVAKIDPRPVTHEDSLPRGTVVRELSFVSAGSRPAVELKSDSGAWTRVPATTTAVAPYLVHVRLPQGMHATAVRFVGTAGMRVSDLVVLAEGA